MRTVYEILRAKREGQELPKEEIAYLVAGVVSGEVPEYQAVRVPDGGGDPRPLYRGDGGSDGSDARLG